MKGKTKVILIKDILDSLEVSETFDFGAFIIENWGSYDYFIGRSFDVHLANVRKLMPEKKFTRKKLLITRIK